MLPARGNFSVSAIGKGIVLILIFFAVAASAQQRYTKSVPSKGEILPGYTLSQFKEDLQSTSAHTIEGVWQYADDGVIFGIEQFTNPDFAKRIAYRIVLLQADDAALLPGTVIGYLAQGALPGHFDIWIYTHFDSEGIPAYPAKCDAALSADTRHISFKKNSKFKFRMRVNMSRMLPSLLKAFSISIEPELQASSLGFVKLFPTIDSDGSETNNSSLQIRYL